MREIDPAKMRALEQNAREIGAALGRALERLPGGRKHFGFTLLLFSYEGPEITYISSAERQDMIKTMLEMVNKLRSEEPGMSHDRN